MVDDTIIFMEGIPMRRWRKPPNICIKPCNSNTGKSRNGQTANCQTKNEVKIEIKIENQINKRPISNGIRAKTKLPNLPKRNRAFLIWFFRMGARPPPRHQTHNHPT